MAHIASSDVQWGQVVTADYTIANGLLQDIWELEPVDPSNSDVCNRCAIQTVDPLGSCLRTVSGGGITPLPTTNLVLVQLSYVCWL